MTDVSSSNHTFYTKHLTSNDTVSLCLSSALLSRVDEGENHQQSIIFRRTDVPIDFVDDMSKPGYAVARRVGKLPPSMNIDISAVLGKFIAKGRSGLVYEVNTPGTVHNADGQEVQIPLLVCKFAVLGRNKEIAREAWFYDEMQTIQGVAVPRCYGLFEATLPIGYKFAPWEMLNTYEIEAPGKYPFEKLCEDHSLGSFLETLENRRILTRLMEPNRVVALLLERLGDYFLPYQQEISDEIKNDAHAVYDVLAEIGIEHCDIRFGNLLATLDSPLAVPGKPSPLHGRVLKCRVIDFELSRKYTGFEESSKDLMYVPLEYLMDGLPGGDINNTRW